MREYLFSEPSHPVHVTCVEGDVRLNPVTTGDITDYYAYPAQFTEENYFINDHLARGRVEICIGGRYRTICSDNWDYEDASVVCSQLGFSPYGELIRRFTYSMCIILSYSNF